MPHQLSLWRRLRDAFTIARQSFDCPTDDPLHRLQFLSRSLVPGYRFTWPQLDWWYDTGFNAFLEKFGEQDGFNIQRFWTLAQLLRLTFALSGDTVECGVWRGASSFLMASSNCGRQNTRHHGFDSFEGLSAPGPRDGAHWARGALASPLDVAQKNLAEFGDAVRLYPGWIPSRFAEVDRPFRFAHLDVDLYEPTRDSLTFCYPRVVPGGIIVCDDYAFTTCPGATAAVDEFLADKPEKMILLPAGGGFLIKGNVTGPPVLGK